MNIGFSSPQTQLVLLSSVPKAESKDLLCCSGVHLSLAVSSFTLRPFEIYLEHIYMTLSSVGFGLGRILAGFNLI